MYPNVHCCTIYNIEDIGVTLTSISRGMDKEVVVHIYNGILISCKKKKKRMTYFICSNMYGPRDCHIE